MVHDADAILGQLALARGMVSFRDLLSCVQETGGGERSFEDVLIARGLLSHSQLMELKDTIEADVASVLKEVEAGQTLVLEHIEHTTNSAPDVGTRPVKRVEALSMERTFDYDPSEVSGIISDLAPTQVDIPTFISPSQKERYELRKMLGKGGMGEVWLAFDRLLSREVALKTLHADTGEHREQMRSQLKLEAQVTGLLEHPSIIPVYDIGELADRGLFYTMRVVREESLERRLDRLRRGEADGERLTQLTSILRTALLALQYAHDHGVVHRDLKPENLLVGAYGEVFVIDWGVAKLHNELGDGSLSGGALASTKRGTLVGTPHYMAPEQALGEHDQVDERTDIYAMGVVLYEVLTLEKVFDARHVLALLFKITEEMPIAPSKRALHRQIPEELEEICLKALSKKPEDRYQSAQEMANDLELFLEGIKEDERAKDKADALMASAKAHRASYHDARNRYADAQEELTRAQMEIQPWASISEKEPLWELEQEVFELRMEIERYFGEATRIYGQALGHVPEHQKARRGLADLYWERFMGAEVSGDEANALYFEGLVRQYNDGPYNTLLAGQAKLSVRLDVPDGVCKIYRYERGMHRLRAIHQETLPCPVVNLRIPHGNYLITVEAPGYIPQRIPLLLERLQEIALEPRLYRVGSLPNDMIVIGEGSFLSGHIKTVDRERYRKHVDGFAIARYPVTCGEYAEFLTWLARADRLDEAHDHAPRIKNDPKSYFKYDADTQTFIVPEEDAEGDSWDPQWPICLVSARDAESYARWRSEQTGLTHRLPTADEWEKAARGVDGRIYAWGNDFDAAFCRVRESTPGRALPAPVGTYPMDCSPYGVMDMTGCIAEWTASWSSDDQKARICQGASFSTMQAACRLDWPFTCPPDFRNTTYGFRLVMELPERESGLI